MLNCIRQSARFFLFVLPIGLFLSRPSDLQAGNAQWTSTPQTSDWNTGQNWTPNTVPNGPGDVATFDFSKRTTVTLSAATEVSDIIFNPSANAYTVVPANDTLLTLSGRGIVNNSTTVQTFVLGELVVGQLASILFANAASAGTNTVLVTHSGLSIGADGGFILFRDNSTADHAVITNNCEGPGFAGITQFHDNASAGNATFHNKGASVAGTGGGGSTGFGDNATADNATFITSGGSAQYAAGGATGFFGRSTAANARFTVRGSTVPNSQGGTVSFAGYATAAHGTFDIEGGSVSGAEAGRVTFSEQATAGDATFVVNGGRVSNGAGGQINFDGGGSAGNGQFTLNGGAPGAQGAWAYFEGGGGSLGSAVFTVNGGAQNGSAGALLQLLVSAADGAVVTVNGGTASGAAGGTTQVTGSAGNPTFNVNGSTTAGASGGTLEVSNEANLDNATVTVTAGSNGGAPGVLTFLGDATGGAASLILNAGTTADMSQHTLGYPLTFGILDGPGTVILGGSELTLGTSNEDDTFPGLLVDGSSSFLHGSLAKTGAGTLILTNANTYTGTTTVNSGTLAVNGSDTGSAMVVNGGIFILNGTSASTVASINGGALMVNGSVPAATTVNSTGTLEGIGRVGAIAVSKGGTVSPGNNNPATLTAAGDLTMAKGSKLSVVIDGVEANQLAVGGQVNLGNAVLSVSLGELPPRNMEFTILSNNGSSPISGMFNKLKQNGKLKVGKHVFRISYRGGDGNDVVVTFLK